MIPIVKFDGSTRLIEGNFLSSWDTKFTSQIVKLKNAYIKIQEAKQELPLGFAHETASLNFASIEIRITIDHD